jgi:nucleoside-diphosphate-sugar epimerase
VKVLFMGGTGNISTACVELCLERGFEVTLLNRGRRASAFAARVGTILGERDEPTALEEAGAGRFDAVVDFLAYPSRSTRQ